MTRRKIRPKPKATPKPKAGRSAGPQRRAKRGGGFRISVDSKECIGCGACASVSRNWKMAGEKSRPKKAVVDKVGDNLDAAESCPVGAIHIFDLARKRKIA